MIIFITKYFLFSSRNSKNGSLIVLFYRIGISESSGPRPGWTNGALWPSESAKRPMATQSIGCPIADIDRQRDKYDNSLKCSRLIKLKVVLRSGCGYYTGRYCRDVLYIYHKVTHQKKQGLFNKNCVYCITYQRSLSISVLSLAGIYDLRIYECLMGEKEFSSEKL